jgi:lysophospholipase L1-like esterase
VIARRRLIGVVVSCGLLVGAAISVAFVAAGHGADANPRANLPTAIVSLGDSAMSGEGAGSYLPGTDGPRDYCHRSADAMIHRTGIKVARSINLACSGATAANLQIGGPGQYAERSQAAQLAKVARTYNVKLLAVQVGANDNPDFSDVIRDCVLAWADPLHKSCAESDGPGWSRGVKAMVPKVEKTIRDLRSVMHSARYADDDYQFVLLSYASPVTEKMKLTHAFDGCPLRKTDAKWGRTVAVPQLSAAEAKAAASTGVRFLSLAQATAGHEACNDAGAPTWENGLTIDLSDLPNGLNDHAAQQSFHPDAQGHREFGRCLGQFYAKSARTGACLVGRNGTLYAATG